MLSPGRKDDQGKAPWSLLMRGCGKALAGVVAVLQFGARKYAPDSWQRVENGADRYRDALYRHLHDIELHGAGHVDPESGLLSYYHLACDALFLAHLATLQVEHDARQAWDGSGCMDRALAGLKTLQPLDGQVFATKQVSVEEFKAMYPPAASGDCAGSDPPQGLEWTGDSSSDALSHPTQALSEPAQLEPASLSPPG